MGREITKWSERPKSWLLGAFHQEDMPLVFSMEMIRLSSYFAAPGFMGCAF
jgi:hypothetical protein